VSLKVAFIGSHGVGKTTLCFALAFALKQHGLHADMVKEVARESPLPINQQTSFAAQTWILMTQIADEIRSASQYDVVVCDRSVLDNYAYLVRACGRQAALEPLIDSWMSSYALLVKVPVMGTAAADGVRDPDEVFVADIDALVDELLLEKRIDPVRLDPARRSDWTDEITQLVLALVEHGAPPRGLSAGRERV